MKKLLTLVLVIVLLGGAMLGLVGCVEESRKDRVQVFLTEEAMEAVLNGKVYTSEDFPEIVLKKVEKRSSKENGIFLILYFENGRSYGGVSTVIMLLEQRDDVASVHRVYYRTIWLPIPL